MSKFHQNYYPGSRIRIVYPTCASTAPYFLRSNVFETPMASLSSVGKSHYEVQQSFSFPSALLYWALASLGYAALLWTTRLFLSSKVEKILACSSEHLSKWKKEDSKQLGPFFESGKHKHLCMSDILICLSVVLFWRKQTIVSLLSAVQLNFNFCTKFQTLCQRKKY